MRIILVYIFIFAISSSQAQIIGSEEIDPSIVRPWQSRSSNEYQGVYHFGDSEVESTLLIIVSGDRAFAQIRSGKFTDDGRWLPEYENLAEVRIDGNRFFSTKSNGEFVSVREGGSTFTGLKIQKPWSPIPEPGQWEIGVMQPVAFIDNFAGKYPQASAKLLTAADLAKMAAQELRIMRNEIFARYGYRFKAGGEMDRYFSEQPWYQKQFDNVDAFLTGVEKANVSLIQSLEK